MKTGITKQYDYYLDGKAEYSLSELSGSQQERTPVPAPSISAKEKAITHETIVLGFNERGEVIFLKSYHYMTQKNEAQSDLKWVIDNCNHWEIGSVTEWKLTHEGICHDIIIQHP